MPRQKSLIRTILEPLAIAVALGFVARAALHLYSIPSSSMAPTLLPGDQIVVTPYFGGEPQRGDVIVFQAGGDELFVKRVIGVPGDYIDSRLGRVRVGGYTLAEPYLMRQASSGMIGAQVVPSDAYFVLGDNRDDSNDSRSWGVVPRAHVVGRARMVLWSSADLGQVAMASGVSESESARVQHGRGRLFKWIE